MVTSRRLTGREKAALVAAIRPLSRRSLRPPDWRPLEVTVLARPLVQPWRYPPSFDLQYGEWLSDTDIAEQVHGIAAASPDLAVVIAILREWSHAYVGLPAQDVLDPVPRQDLVRATLDAMPPLLADLDDDTRNVLLTLARMWTTVATGAIRSKDQAAEWAAERLPPGGRALLDRARRLYLEGGWGEWGTRMDDVRLLAETMADEIRAAAADAESQAQSARS